MQDEKLPFWKRSGKWISAKTTGITPAIMLRDLVNSIIFVLTTHVAMKITGLWPFFNAFVTAHESQISNTLVLYCLLWLPFRLMGAIVYALLKSVFRLREYATPSADARIENI